MIRPRYLLALSMLGLTGWRMTAAQIPEPITAIQVFKEAGVVGLLLVAVVVLFKRNEMETAHTKELLERVLKAVDVISDATEKLDSLSMRLVNVHCPLLDENDPRQPANRTAITKRT